MERFEIRTTTLHLLLYYKGVLDCSHNINSILLVAFMWQAGLDGKPKMASFTHWQPWWHSFEFLSRVALGSSAVVSLHGSLRVVILTEQNQALRRKSPRDSHRNSSASYQTPKSQVFTSKISCSQTKIRAIPIQRETNLCPSDSEIPSYFSM